MCLIIVFLSFVIVQIARQNRDIERERLQRESDRQVVMEELALASPENQVTTDSIRLQERVQKYADTRRQRTEVFLQSLYNRRDQFLEKLLPVSVPSWWSLWCYPSEFLTLLVRVIVRKRWPANSFFFFFYIIQILFVSLNSQLKQEWKCCCAGQKSCHVYGMSGDYVAGCLFFIEPHSTCLFHWNWSSTWLKSLAEKLWCKKYYKQNWPILQIFDSAASYKYKDVLSHHFYVIGNVLKMHTVLHVVCS